MKDISGNLNKVANQGKVVISPQQQKDLEAQIAHLEKTLGGDNQTVKWAKENILQKRGKVAKLRDIKQTAVKAPSPTKAIKAAEAVQAPVKITAAAPTNVNSSVSESLVNYYQGIQSEEINQVLTTYSPSGFGNSAVGVMQEAIPNLLNMAYNKPYSVEDAQKLLS